MKTNLRILLFLISTITLPLSGQTALNGTVQMKKYAGVQPELVKGVSALPATSNPLVRHVCLIDSNIVAITIDERAVILSNLKPYEKQKGDTMVLGGYHGYTKILHRNGTPIGYICGIKNNWLRPFNDIAGEKVQTELLSNPENFSIVSEENSAFKTPVQPLSVIRKTVPVDRTHTSLHQIYPLRHEISLVLPCRIEPGFQYEIRISGTDQFSKPLVVTFTESELRSEAIHVNLLGYAPGDRKIAQFSTWLGDGGAHRMPDSRNFYIIDARSGEKVFQGKSVLISKEPEEAGNYPAIVKTDVHALDFSELSREGSFRLVVENVGCSFEFEISPAVWENTARLLMKGFLHQRSGIELGPPYTDYQRPRNMHPEDEVTIHLCDTEKFFNPGGGASSSEQTGVFERIQASILPDTEVPGAWGGWMDAGDFDQRMTHLYSVRRLMYLCEINPAYFESMNLLIPESGNTIPDIIDEAAWCLDIYKRTQGAYEEGGVSWWIESVEHPRQGEPSWLNSLPTALVPPTPGASLNYAATAAQMALLTRKYDPARSEEYLHTALAAMKWVETHPNTPDIFGSSPRPVYEALAYVHLYRCTGDKKWHALFKDVLKEIFKNGIDADVDKGNAEVLFAYLLIKEEKTDKELAESCKKGIIKLANNLLKGSEENIYNILNEENRNADRLATLSKYVLPVVAAHRITGDRRYYDALTKSIQYAMGANPMNRCYISGLGERFFYPYQIDWEANNMNIPAGIPTFGPIKQTEERWGWTGKWAIDAIERAGLYPNKLSDWPHAEKCFNQTWIAPINEFTVRTPMGEFILLTGYLAQLSTETPRCTVY